ncbi:hypothetical protein BGY98DRAFT_936774 [Russula aff. rugulosa BPL654]|nr:hypothetical protein BGY98DRAFT_936774 [Russula aff. rugulosa BPL654]
MGRGGGGEVAGLSAFGLGAIMLSVIRVDASRMCGIKGVTIRMGGFSTGRFGLGRFNSEMCKHGKSKHRKGKCGKGEDRKGKYGKCKCKYRKGNYGKGKYEEGKFGKDKFGMGGFRGLWAFWRGLDFDGKTGHIAAQETIMTLWTGTDEWVTQYSAEIVIIVARHGDTRGKFGRRIGTAHGVVWAFRPYEVVYNHNAASRTVAKLHWQAVDQSTRNSITLYGDLTGDKRRSSASVTRRIGACRTF